MPQTDNRQPHTIDNQITSSNALTYEQLLQTPQAARDDVSPGYRRFKLEGLVYHCVSTLDYGWVMARISDQIVLAEKVSK